MTDLFRSSHLNSGSVEQGKLSKTPPRVSVIMATFNGARFIRQSINSVLSQTWTDLELIVVDDCSTDETPTILASIIDPRMRVFRNLANCGVVESRNRCFAATRGEYIGMLDHDDLSRPTRIAKQVAYLDAYPETVLVGTDSHLFEHGRLTPTKHPERSSPTLIRWLLHVANPLVCSSIMFRAGAARNLGVLMRKDFDYADDFDLYHRMGTLGQIARLDEQLTIYRLHEHNAFRKHEEVMTANAVKVLVPAYSKWFGSQSEEAARLVVRHLSAGKPVSDSSTLRELDGHFNHLNRSFLLDNRVNETDRGLIESHAAGLWRRMLSNSASQGRLAIKDWMGARMARWERVRGVLPLLYGHIPGKDTFHAFARSRLKPVAASKRRRPSTSVCDTEFVPLPPDLDRPPALYVVVDTEAEFDWTKPFARDLTNVTAMDEIERGQAVFDRYGLRPVYLVDYAVASQERSAERLRRMLERGCCEVGAHLHPWTTPPFDEELSSWNSYSGNLPADLEERKLAALVDAIHSSFGIRPIFYKAGRYGFGRATERALSRHGIIVDFSVMPGADLRKDGGPDFRNLLATPYWLGRSGIVTVPMTRSTVGLLPGLARTVEGLSQSSALKPLRIPSVLSRLRIAETITLCPEGVTAKEQIRLIKALLKSGQRTFVMHYHSPSLCPGHTPYVQTEAEALDFIRRLENVCEFFFETLGGIPGYPRDLAQMRARAPQQCTSKDESIPGKFSSDANFLFAGN